MEVSILDCEQPARRVGVGSGVSAKAQRRAGVKRTQLCGRWDSHLGICASHIPAVQAGKDQTIVPVLQLWQMRLEHRIEAVSELHVLQLHSVRAGVARTKER